MSAVVDLLKGILQPRHWRLADAWVIPNVSPVPPVKFHAGENLHDIFAKRSHFGGEFLCFVARNPLSTRPFVAAYFEVCEITHSTRYFLRNTLCIILFFLILV